MKFSELSALPLAVISGLSACAAESNPEVDGLAETFPAPLPKPAETHYMIEQASVSTLVEPTCDRSWWASPAEFVCVVDEGSERDLTFVRLI